MEFLKKRGTRWGLVNGRGWCLMNLEGNAGEGLWGIPFGGEGERGLPVYGSEESMNDLRKMYRRKFNMRVRAVNFPNDYAPPEPIF